MGQANTDALEAKKQVDQGLEDLKVIMDELSTLPPLDDDVLQHLGSMYLYYRPARGFAHLFHIAIHVGIYYT